MTEWTRSNLEDLRLWALSDRLPPGFSSEDLAAVVELALKGQVESKLLEQVKRLEAENRSLEKENEELADRNDDLLGQLRSNI